MPMEFDEIVKKILEKSPITYDELMHRIKKKQEELKIITPEGAATIVAHELKVNLGIPTPQPIPLYIEDIAPGMSKIDVVGRVVKVAEPKDFVRHTGGTGSRGAFWITDKTGTVRVVLWDERTEILREKKIEKGDIVRIRNAYAKRGINGQPELSLGNRGVIEINPDDPRVAELPPLPAHHVRASEIKAGMGEVDVIGRVMSVGNLKTFEREGGGEGRVASLMISDGSGWIRVSLWDEWAEFAAQLRPGDAVKLENAVVRTGLRDRVELRLGAGGRIIKDHPEALALPEKLMGYLKIGEVDVNMSSASLAGRVVRKFQTTEFSRRDGSKGKVVSAILADEEGIIRASFWDSAVDVAEKMEVGDIVAVENGYTKAGLGGSIEIHAGKNSIVKINPPGITIGRPIEKRVKINEIGGNDYGLTVVGKVLDVSSIREFEREGKIGRVASITIADETGSVRVSLWGSTAEKVHEIKVDDIVKISLGYSMPGSFGTELGVDEDGSILINPPGEEIPQIAPQKKVARRVEIREISKEGEFVEVRGTIVHVVNKKPIFGACPICGKGLGSLDGETVCEECGRSVTPLPRGVITFILDDGTETLRTTLFGKPAEKLMGRTAEEIARWLDKDPDLARFYEEMKIIGREVVVAGAVRYDKFTEGFELMGREMREAGPIEEAELLLERIKGMER